MNPFILSLYYRCTYPFMIPYRNSKVVTTGSQPRKGCSNLVAT